MEHKYSRNCDEIMLHNFTKISNTNDYRYLVIDWDNRSEIEIDQDVCEDLWKDIYGEYCKLSDDNKIILYYETLVDISNLLATKFVLENITTILSGKIDPILEVAYHVELSKMGVPPKEKEKREDYIVRISQYARFMTNKINVKNNELKSLKGDPEEGDVGMTLNDQIVRVEEITGRNLIDPKTTTVAKWIAIIKSLQNGKRK